jgi:hypothetical protein
VTEQVSGTSHFKRDGYVPVWMLACDKLSAALDYLHYSWGVDTPRDHMVANLDARAIFIRLKKKIIDEAELEMNLNNRMEYCDPEMLSDNE